MATNTLFLMLILWEQGTRFIHSIVSFSFHNRNLSVCGFSFSKSRSSANSAVIILFFTVINRDQLSAEEIFYLTSMKHFHTKHLSNGVIFYKS